jgi:hypothetical protein
MPTGAPFPPNFRDVVKTILKRLFRVYAHIYHSHFQMIMNLEEVKHLNTCFKHFTLFIMVNSISTSMQITVSRSPFVTFNSACKYLLEGHTNIRLVVDKDERTFDLSHDFPTRMTFYPTVARLYIHSSVLIISELSWLLWFSYAIVKKFHLKKKPQSCKLESNITFFLSGRNSSWSTRKSWLPSTSWLNP